MTYCEYVLLNPQDTFNKVYHDTQYGFPIREDNALFERLVLEINQAGLSWLTILKKADNFRRAYEGFDVDRVSGYGEDDRDRECSPHPDAAHRSWLVRELAGPESSDDERRLDACVQEDVRLHRGRDRAGVPALHGIPCRCPRGDLPHLCHRGSPKTALAAGPVIIRAAAIGGISGS
jgi:hypothetical protein